MENNPLVGKLKAKAKYRTTVGMLKPVRVKGGEANEKENPSPQKPDEMGEVRGGEEGEGEKESYTKVCQNAEATILLLP